MSWIIVIGILVVIAIGAFLLWRHPDVGRDDLPEMVRQLLVLAKNGGVLRVDVRQENFWFSIERYDGDDQSATFALRIPRHEHILNAAEPLEKAFLSNGFDWMVEDQDNPSLFAKVLDPVDNIWDESSGARGAHAVRILMDEIGLPAGSRFKVQSLYEASYRYKMRDQSGI